MRRTLVRLLLGLLATLAGLVLLDGAFAIGEYIVYGARWSQGRPVGLYQHTGPGRPQLVPGAHLPGLLYDIHVNSMGFRGPDLAAVRPDNALRIWCLGGSTTFDIYAPDDDSTWPARAGTHLQATLPGRSVEVINAGLPGEVLAGNADDLRRWAPRVRPDYVVIYGGPNDLRQAMNQLRPGPLPDAVPAGMDFALARILQRWLVPYRTQAPAWAGRRAGTLDIDAFRDRVEALVRGAEGMETRPVLATHALFDDPSAPLALRRRRLSETCWLLQQEPDGVADTFRRANAMVTRIASAHHLPLADVAAAVPPQPEYWGDSIHFAAAGSDLAGQVVADAILADMQAH